MALGRYAGRVQDARSFSFDAYRRAAGPARRRKLAHEAGDLNRVDQCLRRAELERERAAAEPDAEKCERHLDRAALWTAIAEAVACERQTALAILLGRDPRPEAADSELVASYLAEAPVAGTA